MQFILIFMLFVTSAFGSEIYKIKDKTIKGEDFSMEQFKGKTILVVNIASQCGYTKQLEGLETIYKKYKNKNFVVLGVPTNDFGGQTPEDDQGMLEFCQKTYNVTFPILKKSTVLGKEKRELYRYLTEKTPKEFQGEIGWNFEKFLIGKDGEVKGRFNSRTEPGDRAFRKQIEGLL